MENISKEIKTLLSNIEKDSDFQLRKSEFYEPWDISKNCAKDMADTFYYYLCDCIRLLKKVESN